MRGIFLNPHSLSGQARDTDEVELILRRLIECLDYIRIAIFSGAMVLLYDNRFEDRALRAGEGPVAHDLGNCRDRDLD